MKIIKIQKYSVLLIALFWLGGCSPHYDYTIHKPDVKYAKPSKYALQSMLKESEGKPYVWAEEGPGSFDCSGLTYYSYASMNLWLPRRAIEQSRVGQTVSISKLQYGDLIFFDTSHKGRVNHVGIYIGNGLFRHASSRKEEVITSTISKGFYRHRIVVCKRVIPQKCKVVKSKSWVDFF